MNRRKQPHRPAGRFVPARREKNFGTADPDQHIDKSNVLQKSANIDAAVAANLSQQGALIRSIEKLSLMQRVKIRAEGMPEITGKVRWRRNDSYGLSFEDTFQFAELAALAFDLRRSA